MTEQYTPTTEEVLGMLGSYLHEYGAGCDMNLPGNSPDEIVERWLAEHDRQVAEKAWDEAIHYLAPDDVEIMWAVNPYRRIGAHGRASARRKNVLGCR